MRLRPIILALCVLSLSALVALPAHAQLGVPPITSVSDPDYWGAPQFQAWPSGYFIWIDDQGVHVRWTSARGETHRFYGEATVQGTISYFQPAYPDRSDAARRLGNRMFWDTFNSGGGDGFDFAMNQGDVVQSFLLIDGRTATRDEIFLGARALHPSANPFALRFGALVGVVPGSTVLPAPDLWGAPQFQVWPNGYFVWTDDQGFHVRWTSARGETHRFYGEAAVQGRITFFQPAYFDRSYAVRRQGNRIFWDLPNSGGGDGFDFAVNQGDAVQFSLLIDGRTATRDEIFLGARALHPSANPFALRFGALVGVIPGPAVAPTFDLWGAPQFQVWPNGYFIWTDDRGFHVRWTSARGETHRFYGEAMVQGRIMAFRPTYPDRYDATQHQGNRQGSRMFWDTSNSGAGDGFDFAMQQGDVVQFSLWIDARMAMRDEVFLGARASHPWGNPFKITR